MGSFYSWFSSIPKEESPASSSSPAPRGINSTDIKTLRHIMAQLDPPTSSSTSFACAGNFANFPCALLANSQQPWIIDSGVSDHLTSLSIAFSTYTHCSGKGKVKTVNGTISSISGKGVIHTSGTAIIINSSCS